MLRVASHGAASARRRSGRGNMLRAGHRACGAFSFAGAQELFKHRRH